MLDSETAILYDKMRSLISLVDRLRDFNLQDYISLPRIAVLGEQSAGKSSLLESICGLNFLPRGSGIVTRRPLELRMVKANVPLPYFIFPCDHGDKKFTNTDQVRSTIEYLTDKGAGSSKNISDVPIVCTVYSQFVPDLTLIDLPGITRNPTADQPDNIEEITKGLVRKYCDDPNTLILCVIPANIDLSTSDAFAYARKLDPKGQRTLGVITKIDLMDEGTDCKALLLNEEIILKHGYVGVKGRSQAEINRQTTVAQAIQNELDYFAKHPVYSSLPSELLGTRAMIDRTSAILYTIIKTSLPSIKKEIEDRKRKAIQQIKELGEEVPNTDDRKLELVFKLIRKFKDLYDQEVNGKYVHHQINFKKGISKHHPLIKNETLAYTLSQNFNELYKEYSDKDFKVSKEYTNDKIRHAIDVYQGESIPGFYSFDAFLYLVTPKLEMLKQPAIFIINETKSALEIKGIDMIDRVFKKYQVLNQEIKNTFAKHLNNCMEKAKKIIDHMLRNEESYLFTNDSLVLTGELLDPKLRLKYNTTDIIVEELRARLDRYFTVVVKNLKDSIPKIIGQFMVKKFNESLEVEILNDLIRRDYYINSLSENKSNMALRNKINSELDSLSKAENLLVNEFDMEFDIGQEFGMQETDPKTLEEAHRFTDFDDLIDADLLMNIDQINEDFLQLNHQIIKNDIIRLTYNHRDMIPERTDEKTLHKINDKRENKLPITNITPLKANIQNPYTITRKDSQIREKNADEKHKYGTNTSPIKIMVPSQKDSQIREKNSDEKHKYGTNTAPIKMMVPSQKEVSQISHQETTTQNVRTTINTKTYTSINGNNNPQPAPVNNINNNHQPKPSVIINTSVNPQIKPGSGFEPIKRMDSLNKPHNLFGNQESNRNLFTEKNDRSLITTSKLNERDQPIYSNTQLDPFNRRTTTNNDTGIMPFGNAHKQPPLIQPKPKKISKNNLFGD